MPRVNEIDSLRKRFHLYFPKTLLDLLQQEIQQQLGSLNPRDGPLWVWIHLVWSWTRKEEKSEYMFLTVRLSYCGS